MIKRKILGIFFLLNIFLAPMFAFAQSTPAQDAMSGAPTASASRAMNQIQKEYNAELLKKLSEKLFTNPAIGWKTGGLLKTIFVICFLIAFIQAVSNRSPEGMVTDMAKLAFYSWLVMALVGGPTYSKFSFLNVSGGNGMYSGGTSLDMDIFNFVAYQADALADSMFEAGGPDALGQQMAQSSIMIKNMMNAKKTCKAGNTFCYSQFKDTNKVVDPKTIKTDKDATPPSESIGGAVSKALTPDAMAKILDYITQIVELFSDLTFLMFYIISWIVDLIRAVVTQFLLIAFGIITGIAFFLAKVFIPFAILPKYRGRVFQTLKIPLSAALYGFASSLIVFVSGACFEAMNGAAVSVIYNKVLSGSSGAELTWVIPNVIISMMAGMILVTVLQVVAITKVPALCKDIMNLSMDSIVGFAQELGSTLTSAAMTLGAGVITSGVTLGAGVGGGALGRLIGGVKGGINGVSQSLGFRAPFAGSGFKDFAGSGSGGGGPRGGSGGGTVGGVGLAAADSVRGATASVTATAAGLANQESLIAKDGGKKENNARNFDDKELAAMENATKADATQADKEKAAEILREKRLKEIEGEAKTDKKKGPDLFSTVISAATGNRNAFDAYFGSKAVSAQKAMMGGTRSALGMNADDGLSTGLGRVYANKRDASQTAVSNFALKTAGYMSGESMAATKNAAAAIGKTDMNSAQKSSLNSSIAEYQSSGNVSDQAKTEMFALRNSSNMSDEQKTVVDQILNEDAMESIAKIKAGQYTNDDLAKVYKASNSEFRSSEFEKQLDSLNSNEEYQKFATTNYKINNDLSNQLLSKGLKSEKGQEAAEQLRTRLEEGLIARNSYRSSVSTEVDRIKHQMDATLEQQAKFESQEAVKIQSQIPKIEEQIRKLEEAQEKERKANPYSTIKDDPKIGVLKKDLEEAMLNKQIAMDSLMDKLENSPMATRSQEVQSRLSALNLQESSKYAKGQSVMDILKDQNPDLYNRKVNRAENKEAYSKGYNAGATEDIDLKNMSFSRTDGKVDDEFVRRQGDGFGGYKETKAKEMHDTDIRNLEDALAERKREFANYKDDDNVKSAAENLKYGRLAAEIEAIEQILKKHKKS